MIIQVKDLKPNMQVIYKLNYPNGKIYIGLTTDLQRRMWEHNNLNINKPRQVCDKAIMKYGKMTEVEILEFITDIEDLEEREKYWIKYYNANSKEKGYNLNDGGSNAYHVGEDNTRAVFTNNEVLDIRKRRYFGERKKDVYQSYQNYSFATFEKIWLGKGYPDIGREYLIPTGEKSRAEYSHEANKGTNNGRAKCTYEQVLEIRRLREKENKSFREIQKIFPHIGLSSIRRIAIRESYKDIE